ncbi:hypothetical protein HF086_017798 [Spodoptera exigua]|uniref:Fatty acyl-CoA reductase n=1 Tax=Spodoptera exigua TaxID=7107 RepID=A0A922SH83_SPOEX|nr:hypothetical protein HF086_017798 [Spodoptera exigua]
MYFCSPATMVPRPVSPSPAEPLIPRFYAGRSILITGATGFMGKVLVERILATCPDVGRLHLLMRDKKGHSPQKRLAQLKQSQVFDNVRARNHRQLDKLCVVSGDVSKPQLGMDAEAIAQLREVSIVFHSAATLKFDEPLPVAIEQNVRSVERLLDICDKLPNMAAFIHVSTAYSNAELTVVEERVYPAPVPLSQACTLAETLPVDLLGQINTQPESVRVYNCSTCENPTTWREFETALRHHLRGHPLDNALWYPSGITVENKYTQKTLETVLQTAPLHIAEYVSKILGIKTSWNEHYCNFIKGARKYLLQEKDQDIEEARKHLRRMYYLHQGVIFFVVTLLCRLALRNQYLRAFVYRTFRMLLTVAGSAYTRIRQS